MDMELVYRSERFINWWEYRFPHRSVTEWLHARRETQMYYYRKYLSEC